jgi:hypothetical protein
MSNYLLATLHTRLPKERCKLTCILAYLKRYSGEVLLYADNKSWAQGSHFRVHPCPLSHLPVDNATMLVKNFKSARADSFTSRCWLCKEFERIWLL